LVLLFLEELQLFLELRVNVLDLLLDGGKLGFQLLLGFFAIVVHFYAKLLDLFGKALRAIRMLLLFLRELIYL
jgi:hypothetical protein